MLGLAKKELQDDSTLLKRAKKGNTEAFGKLYLKYLDPIYRYTFFRVGQNVSEAEDITELIFLKAWEHIKEFKENGKSFKAWLYTIAHNAVIDYYRSHKTTAELTEEIPEQSKGLEENLTIKDDYQDVLQAMNKLTDEQKALITMKFIDGLSNKEICQILHKNEEAIRAMQYRAIKQLRQILE